MRRTAMTLLLTLLPMAAAAQSAPAPADPMAAELAKVNAKAESAAYSFT